MAASMGWASQVGVIASADAAPTSQFEFLSCDVGKRAALIESPGMRGTRSHFKDSVNEGPYTVSGSLVMEPRPDELAFWLPFILGTSGALTEAIAEFCLTVDKVAAVYKYTGCKVNRARFQSQERQNLKMTLEIEGKTEVPAAAGTFPDLSATLSVLQPYIHQQGVLTVGSAKEFKTAEVLIDNALVLDRFLNSLTRTELSPGDRIIKLTTDNPFTSDELALYVLAIAGSAATLVYTNGTKSVTFSFANLKVPAQGPAIQSRTAEIPLRLEFQAFQDGATKELVVTNDAT